MSRQSGRIFRQTNNTDETGVHHYNPETKVQSKQWKHYDSPSPKKARVQPSACKIMLTVFWDQRGEVTMDFLAKGSTITGTYFVSLLKKLQNAIKTERRGMLTKGFRLLQHNAPVHNSFVVQTEARSCGYEVIPHPPYSPDLAPSDLHLFPSMKSFLKGTRFSSDESMASGTTY